MRSGVPKLSLGEKATLTIQPDYVRDRYLILLTVSSDDLYHRRTALVDSLP